MNTRVKCAVISPYYLTSFVLEQCWNNGHELDSSGYLNPLPPPLPHCLMFLVPGVYVPLRFCTGCFRSYCR